jgi:hypothetical protein
MWDFKQNKKNIKNLDITHNIYIITEKIIGITKMRGMDHQDYQYLKHTKNTMNLKKLIEITVEAA